MKVSIVIPNYNGERYVEKCIDSVFLQTFSDFEVILIDNASTDDSVKILQARQDERIQYLFNKENKGFAAAVNQGIVMAKGQYIALLNNDTEVEPNWLEQLVQAIEANEKIFSVSSRMMRYDDRSVIDDAGDYYTILGWAYKNGDGETGEKHLHRKTVFSACAGAALYRKSIFDEIGLFDEDFFAYMEDVDIGYRAKLYGYRNIYCPEAVVYHIGSATSGSKYNEFKIALGSRNNLYVVYKNMPLLQWIINLLFLLVGDTVKWMFFAKKGYGKLYCKGKWDALKSLGKIKKVPFSIKRIPNYVKVEFEIITNTMSYFLLFFKRVKR